MKKQIFHTFIAFTFLITTAPRADEASAPVSQPAAQEEAVSTPTPEEALPAAETATPTEETPPPQVVEERAPREVGKAAVDGVDTCKQRRLGNIVIALLAVAVATTAIILVSKNEGKHP